MKQFMLFCLWIFILDLASAQIMGSCQPYNVSGSGTDVCGPILQQNGYSVVFEYNGTTQAEFNGYIQLINEYSTLIPANCYPVLLNFVCGNAFPRCLQLPSPNDTKVLVFQPFCRSSCDNFLINCSAIVNNPLIIDQLPAEVQGFFNCSAVNPQLNQPAYPVEYSPWVFPENPGVLVYCEGKVPPSPPPTNSVPPTDHVPTHHGMGTRMEGSLALFSSLILISLLLLQ